MPASRWISLQQWWQRRQGGAASASDAEDQLARALQLGCHEEVHDLLTALLLSECVYKAVSSEGGPEASTAALNDLRAQFPQQLMTLNAVQYNRRGHMEHRWVTRMQHMPLLHSRSIHETTRSWSSLVL